MHELLPRILASRETAPGRKKIGASGRGWQTSRSTYRS
jgi:hypothetical protein